MTRLRRTMLYVPGNNAGMLKDVAIYPADCILFDLEDSVSINEKDAARFLVQEALGTMDYSSKECFVRINSLESGLGLADLEAVVPTAKVGIRLPKTETAGDVLECETEIARIERRYGMPEGSTSMMAAIESAKGVLRAEEIALSSKRLIGIALGAEDYVTDLRTERSSYAMELMFARNMVLLAARSAGISAIDTVYSDVNNEAGLLDEVRLIRQLGFDGKSVINPRQIAIVHQVFAPTEEQVHRAQEIIQAIKEAEQRGSGVISLHGKMIDKPIVMRAKWVIERAIASGMIVREAENG